MARLSLKWVRTKRLYVLKLCRHFSGLTMIRDRKLEVHWLNKADMCRVLPRYGSEFVEYILYGVQPGELVAAVLRNDLAGAFSAALGANFNDLRALAEFSLMHVPEEARGSRARMRRWSRAGGLAAARKAA